MLSAICRALLNSKKSSKDLFSEKLSSLQKQACRNTTVLCVRKDGDVVMVADGQATMGSQIVKPNVVKLRRINDKVIGGFAGSTADAFTLFDNLDIKLEQHPDQIVRAAVELAKLWRTDKFLRKLDAVLLVADIDTSLEISGLGDVLEPHDGLMAIGSGGSYALAAARALIDIPGLTARQIAEKAMKIAADSDVYTNHNFVWQVLTPEGNNKKIEDSDKDKSEEVDKTSIKKDDKDESASSSSSSSPSSDESSSDENNQKQ